LDDLRKKGPFFQLFEKSNNRPEVRATIKEEKEEGKTKHENVNK